MLKVGDAASRHWNNGAAAYEIRILINGVTQLRFSAASIGAAGRNIVPIAALREPHMMLHGTGDAVYRCADSSCKDVVSEHKLIFFVIRPVILRPLVVQRSAERNACVISFSCHSIDIWSKVVAQAYRAAHSFEMVREDPEALLHRHILGRVGLEDRSEYSGLQPAGIELRVCFANALRLHMASDIVAPVAVAHIGCCSREIWKE